jgi:hypothetical protein
MAKRVADHLPPEALKTYGIAEFIEEKGDGERANQEQKVPLKPWHRSIGNVAARSEKCKLAEAESFDTAASGNAVMSVISSGHDSFIAASLRCCLHRVGDSRLARFVRQPCPRASGR